jgi:hypothetical protein
MLPISLLKGSCVRNESALRKDQDLYLLRCPLPSRRRTTLSALAEQLRSALLQSSLFASNLGFIWPGGGVVGG